MKVAVVTTFAPDAPYGSPFVQSFLEKWPDDVRLNLWLEGPREESSARVTIHDLCRQTELMRFKTTAAIRERNPPQRLPEGPDYRYQAARFAHKVFAMTAEVPEVDWWIWCDADVTWTAPVDRAFFAATCPPGKTVTYLGRVSPHSETGFLAFHLPGARPLLDAMRYAYTSGHVFDNPNGWTDCDVFDEVRQQIVPQAEWNDLCLEQRRGHVWPRSILGRYSDHAKGPKRKIATYGR
jgi:hypothetical protein